MTAWLAPLPPNPCTNRSPCTVSPRPGTRAVYAIWSIIVLPTTVSHGPAPPVTATDVTSCATVQAPLVYRPFCHPAVVPESSRHTSAGPVAVRSASGVPTWSAAAALA